MKGIKDMYYVTFSGKQVVIHDSKTGARHSVYYVNHDIVSVQVNGDEFYVVGAKQTTTFRRTGQYSFTRAAQHLN